MATLNSCILITLFSWYIILSPNLSAVFGDEHSHLKNESTIERWKTIDKKIREQIESLLDGIFSSNFGKNMNVSLLCMKETLHLVTGLRQLQPWALSFVDSSGKGIDGLLTGTSANFGAYDECQDIIVPSKTNAKNGRFRGQYCSIDIMPPLPSEKEMDELQDFQKNMSTQNLLYSLPAKYAKKLKIISDAIVIAIRLGVCVPSGCTQQDVDNVVKKIAEKFLVSGQAIRCEVKVENKFTSIQIFVIWCFSVMALLVLIGTSMHVYSFYKKVSISRKLCSVLLAFSLVENVRSLLDTKTTKKELRCLNGFRFITMTWIIHSHTYLLNHRVMLSAQKFLEFPKSFAFQAIINGTVAVNTFFFIGGFLVCYVNVKRVKQEKKTFKILPYIVHRLFRIFPPYAFLVMSMFLKELMGSGPIWQESTTLEGKIGECKKYWWRNLLFIGNFFAGQPNCLSHTWYLDVDFQLHLLSLVVLLPLLRCPKVGISLSVVGILISTVSSGFAAYVINSPLTVVFSDLDFKTILNMLKYSSTPLPHLGSYCIGILAGYLCLNKPDVQIPRKMQIIGWILAFICNSFLLYGTVNWNREIYPSLFESVIYGSLFRTLWAGGVAWVVICCATGHGGIINSILSWTAFVPLGRLSFMAYLVHPVVQSMYLGRLRALIMANYLTLVWMFFASLVASYLAAFALSLLIEMPFTSLGKIILQQGKEIPKDNPVENGIHTNGIPNA